MYPEAKIKLRLDGSALDPRTFGTAPTPTAFKAQLEAARHAMGRPFFTEIRGPVFMARTREWEVDFRVYDIHDAIETLESAVSMMLSCLELEGHPDATGDLIHKASVDRLVGG